MITNGRNTQEEGVILDCNCIFNNANTNSIIMRKHKLRVNCHVFSFILNICRLCIYTCTVPVWRPAHGELPLNRVGEQGQRYTITLLGGGFGSRLPFVFGGSVHGHRMLRKRECCCCCVWVIEREGIGRRESYRRGEHERQSTRQQKSKRAKEAFDDPITFNTKATNEVQGLTAKSGISLKVTN